MTAQQEQARAMRDAVSTQLRQLAEALEQQGTLSRAQAAKLIHKCLAELSSAQRLDDQN